MKSWKELRPVKSKQVAMEAFRLLTVLTMDSSSFLSPQMGNQ